MKNIIKILVMSIIMASFIITTNVYSNDEVNTVIAKQINSSLKYYAVKPVLVKSNSKTGAIQKRWVVDKWIYSLPFEANITVKCVGRTSGKVLKVYNDVIKEDIVRDKMGRFHTEYEIVTIGCGEVNYGCARGNCQNGYGSLLDKVTGDPDSDIMLTGKFKDGELLYGYQKTNKKGLFESSSICPVCISADYEEDEDNIFINNINETINQKDVLRELLIHKIIDIGEFNSAIDIILKNEKGPEKDEFYDPDGK